MYKSFSMDSMWGHYCSIECEDLKERKGLLKDRILTMIVIIITKKLASIELVSIIYTKYAVNIKSFSILAHSGA